MSLSSTPRPLSLRHCLTVPTAVAEGTGHAPDPSPRSADAPPRLRSRVRHPQPAAALAAIVGGGSRVAVQPVGDGADGAPPSPAAAASPADTVPAVPQRPLGVPALRDRSTAEPTPISLPTALVLPEPLTVPGVAYDLAGGDTLAGVARSHGIELEVLLTANDLDAASILYVGERILIPGARARVARPSAASV